MEVLRPVLVADDNPDDIRLLQFAWARAKVSTPLHVLTAGEEVLDYLAGAGAFSDRRRFPLPRLLLLDLKMPRKDGFEVLEWIRSKPGVRRLPVLVLTASLHQQDVERALDLGASAFLIKPVELNRLIDLVKAIDLFWLTFTQS